MTPKYKVGDIIIWNNDEKRTPYRVSEVRHDSYMVYSLRSTNNYNINASIHEHTHKLTKLEKALK